MPKAEKPKIETINDKLYLEVSKELNIPVKTIKDVFLNGQSKFTASTMADNTFNGIRWPYFGVFKAKHKAVQILNYMRGLEPAQRQFFKDMVHLNYLKEKQQRKLLKAQEQKNRSLPPPTPA